MLGTYEYSDFPMDTANFGVSPGEHIPGTVLHEYLTAYAERFGVYERIRFNTCVESVEEKVEVGGWILNITDTTTNEKAMINAKRLVVATGLTSEPHVPTFVGQGDFASPIFHSKDFALHAGTLKTARSVAVLGGAKSAWDAAYAYATAGIPVDMIIRNSGRGPVWMAPAYVTPLKKWLEKLVHTRCLQLMSPCVWGDEDGYASPRRFLHGTWLGRKMVDTFWGVLGDDVVTLNGYNDPKHPEMKKLKPRNSAFWVGSGLSILNYPTDFFELIRNGSIRIHLADVTHLSEKTVHLSNGEHIKTDALFCATGWKSRPPITFLPAGLLAELGMPHYSSTPDPLVKKADAAILAKFPRLKDQPITARPKQGEDKKDTPNQPFLLHRFIAPPSTLQNRNIVFAGMISTITTSICAQTQALWISAYFDGKLARLASPATARWETVLHSRFGKWRYPCGYGDRLPDFVFDAVPYVDMLLKDVGLESHRKKTALAEMTEPYGPEDYRGLVGEWASKYRDGLEKRG
ncbi:FAD/NAD(P)-binding domain-containing protein [Dothidotthia symphoricarpi CBS 119687]|uniref:FAD/NAD(P)-binding domain-containing protein n=1 Tax=Dothidotthia symphoricarpi CBS 119687 TaxID=1392245 RepID=A0A6A6APH1_9PLEO|nr:FAD/NAD(P)-binding domain-containing protein [Dothidotthia symphoricarpi CBS 119687]KAF2133690.1 FAD/NAD(P)-binding domain-containing protein [Dothidotthia symphoricarpi CBS 119687]